MSKIWGSFLFKILQVIKGEYCQVEYIAKQNNHGI